MEEEEEEVEEETGNEGNRENTNDDTQDLIEGEEEEEEEQLVQSEVAKLEDLQIVLQFANAVRNAQLDEGKLGQEVLHRLRNPIQAPLVIEDPDVLFSIRLFFNTSRASQATYSDVRETVMGRHPEDKILSYDQVRKTIRDESGVAHIVDDMCPKSCIAYTGPTYSQLEACPKCGTERYDPVILQQSGGRKKVPQQQFYTIPVGPQLQALESFDTKAPKQ